MSDNACNACWREAKRESDLCLECQTEYHQYLQMRELRLIAEQSRTEYVSVIRSEAGLDHPDDGYDDFEEAPF